MARSWLVAAGDRCGEGRRSRQRHDVRRPASRGQLLALPGDVLRGIVETELCRQAGVLEGRRGVPEACTRKASFEEQRPERSGAELDLRGEQLRERPNVGARLSVELVGVCHLAKGAHKLARWWACPAGPGESALEPSQAKLAPVQWT